MANTQNDKNQLNNDTQGQGGQFYTSPLGVLIPSHRHSAVLLSAAKKTEKIANAVLLIAEFVNDNDALQNAIRGTITNLLSESFRIARSSRRADADLLRGVQIGLEELLSWLSIMETQGYVTGMNARLITREIVRLQERLALPTAAELAAEHLRPATAISATHLTLSDEMFTVADGEAAQVFDSTSARPNSTAETTTSNPYRRQFLTSHQAPAPTPETAPAESPEKAPEPVKRPDTPTTPQTPVVPPKSASGTASAGMPGAARHTPSERRSRIVAILKADGPTTISKLSDHVPGYSAKTIQRDLAELIKNNIVIKSGDKRWAVYSLNDDLQVELPENAPAEPISIPTIPTVAVTDGADTATSDSDDGGESSDGATAETTSEASDEALTSAPPVPPRFAG